MEQLVLDDILMEYQHGAVENQCLYQYVARKKKISQAELNKTVEIGNSGKYTSAIKRQIRWFQQTLKSRNLLERVGKGQWCLTREGKSELSKLTAGKFLVAAHTDLGVMVWGDCRSVFASSIDKDIQLCFTSPPYLGIKRNYGHNGVNEEREYCQFIIDVLKPIAARMKPGASLAINLPNDVYIPRSNGRRSTYLERLTLMIEDEVGLMLMDRVIWHPRNKLPAPTFATKPPYTHLKQSYEFVLWFNNSSSKCHEFANNQSLLKQYSAGQQALINQGGELQARVNSDGNYIIKQGAFANDNGGALPCNVIEIGTTCNAYGRQVSDVAKQMGFIPHGAAFPLNFARHIIAWLATPGKGLCVDPFGGRLTTAKACEELGIDYLVSELHYEYIKPALTQFIHHKEFLFNPAFNAFK